MVPMVQLRFIPYLDALWCACASEDVLILILWVLTSGRASFPAVHTESRVDLS